MQIDWTAIGAFGTMLAAIAALITAVIAFISAWITRVQSFGDILLRLDQGFEQCKDLRERLYNAWFQRGNISDRYFRDHEFDLSFYMTLFERMQMLIDRKIAKTEIVDRLYGFKFFILVSHRYVHNLVFSHRRSWIDFIKLWKALEDRREGSRREFPRGYTRISREGRPSIFEEKNELDIYHELTRWRD